jgi:hypothetical protein
MWFITPGSRYTYGMRERSKVVEGILTFERPPLPPVLEYYSRGHLL